jgi:acetylglutamate kinase
MLTKLIDKAAVLIEALPFLQRYRGEVIVIKLGGSSMEDPVITESIMTDIGFMSTVGMHPVIVHGGGKAISNSMKEAGIEAKFINGLRITDKETIHIVERVLHEEISPGIVDRIQANGMQARILPGPWIMHCKKQWYINPESGTKTDLGFVGMVVSVDPRPIRDLINQQIIPVISPLGVDEKGNTYNNNADTAAGEIAIAIKSRKIVFLSDVNGVMRVPGDNTSFISSLHSTELDTLVREGVVMGGMLPKVKAGIKAIQSGIKKAHIIDGNIKHSLLLELFTEEGIGTEIIG